MPRTVLPSLSELARAVAADASVDGYRVTIGLIEECRQSSAADVSQAIETEPPHTGDARIDSLLAAAAEHVAFHCSIAVPKWISDPTRSLVTAWFPVDLPSLRVRGLVSSPASFARRGIYIDRSDLERV